MAYIARKVYRSGQENLIIESAHPSDAQEFLSFILRVDSETDFLISGPDEFHMTLEDEEHFIAEKLESPRDILLTARYNGILAGTLVTNSNRLNRYKHKISFGVSVLRDYWGLGIGKILIQTMLEWADANGIVKISLEADTLNSRAIRLYKSMGFIEEGLLKLDRHMENAEFRDSLIMARFNPYLII